MKQDCLEVGLLSSPAGKWQILFELCRSTHFILPLWFCSAWQCEETQTFELMLSATSKTQTANRHHLPSSHLFKLKGFRIFKLGAHLARAVINPLVGTRHNGNICCDQREGYALPVAETKQKHQIILDGGLLHCLCLLPIPLSPDPTSFSCPD